MSVEFLSYILKLTKTKQFFYRFKRLKSVSNFIEFNLICVDLAEI